jgi:starch synthase (maltosyl-transferring)
MLAGRIPVTRVTPALPDGRWRPKAFEGEVVPFRATVFREGHDQVGAMLVLTSRRARCATSGCRRWRPGTDRWEAEALLDEQGVWHWHVTGFDDEVATWRHDAALKIDAGVDASSCTRSARASWIARSRRSRARRHAAPPHALAAGLRDTAASDADRRALVDAPALDVFTAWPLAELTTDSPEHEILVERRRAGVGAWYEFFRARRARDA